MFELDAEALRHFTAHPLQVGIDALAAGPGVEETVCPLAAASMRGQSLACPKADSGSAPAAARSWRRSSVKFMR
jgi:hypothetical protein